MVVDMYCRVASSRRPASAREGLGGVGIQRLANQLLQAVQDIEMGFDRAGMPFAVGAGGVGGDLAQFDADLLELHGVARHLVHGLDAGLEKQRIPVLHGGHGGDREESDHETGQGRGAKAKQQFGTDGKILEHAHIPEVEFAAQVGVNAGLVTGSDVRPCYH
jgi:hypothetical protein